MHRLFILLFFITISHLGFSNNLFISGVVYNKFANTLNFDVAWDNGFKTVDNSYDYVYLFVKYRNSNDPNWYPMYFPISGHSPSATDQETFVSVASLSVTNENFERFGIAIQHGALFNSGSTDVNVTIKLSSFVSLVNPSFKVFGIEMVHPSGDINVEYFIGDGTSANRFHAGNDINAPYYRESDMDSIVVGNGVDEINTTSGHPLPVTSIPKYFFQTGKEIMRYEITQKQYVDFLNCLSRTAQNQRTGTDITGTTIANRYVMSSSSNVTNRNGIKCDATLPAGGPIEFYCDLDDDDIPNESNDGQNISVNFMLPGDLLAYLDWAGLKPMNEIQYEFFCRGTAIPVPDEFAWASAMKTAAILDPATSGKADEVASNVGSDGLFRNSANPMRTGSSATQFSNRSQAGASFWGIMDLSGNAAELVIGTYSTSDFPLVEKGDGILDLFGNALSNWPTQMVTKGLSTGDTNLNSTSHRHTGSSPYVSDTIRGKHNGGRGTL